MRTKIFFFFAEFAKFAKVKILSYQYKYVLCYQYLNGEEYL